MEQHTIDNVTISVDPAWKKIAISVSGGADSALLSFLICTLINDNVEVHVINHTRMWKTRPWQSHDGIVVYNWLTSRFPNLHFTRHTNFIAPELEYGNIGPTLVDEYGKHVSGDNIEQRAFAEFICHTHNIDAYFNGVTRNPRSIPGMSERDIERTAETMHLEIMQHMGKWAMHPFRFIDKSWVIKQYIDNDITDLLDITRSCEGEFSQIDYTNYVFGQPVPTCNQCFWCKEREWAIEQNK